MTNINELLKKVATTDMSGGGLLNTEQAKKFLNYVIDESVLKNNARMIQMNSESFELSKIGVGGRVARPKSEGTAPTSGEFVGIDTDTVTLVQKKIVVPFKITEETFEYNIEGEMFEDTMLQMVASQLANDLEELFISGDITSTDAFLAMANGWLLLMTSGGHNVSTAAPLTKTVFSKLKRALPTKYRRRYKDLRFFVNPDNMQDYRDSLASRDTNLGDAAVIGDQEMVAFGVPIVEVPMIPKGTVILTHKSNFIVGMGRNGMQLLKDKNIYSNERLYALHMGVACQIENTDAIAYTENVTDAP